MKHIRVEGTNNFVRDTESGAIININNSEFVKAKMAKANRKRQEHDIENLKNDVGEIKQLLQQLLEKK